MGLCELAWTPEFLFSNSIHTYTCLSNNSLTSWISIKFVSAISHVCSIGQTIFSLKQTLERKFYTAGWYIASITWTPFKWFTENFRCIDYSILIHIYRAWNSSRPLGIFQPISGFGWTKSDMLGQVCCTFPMGKPFIVYDNVPTFNEWPTGF